ncbi:hypothetical protein Hdeb2414_s0131g00806881 [Helianthus debilis subsp. tardiflorus]
MKGRPCSPAGRSVLWRRCLIKKVILIRLMLWGLLMMLLILFERFLFALSFGLIFLCLYNIKVTYCEIR